jgi:hypothetical protein
VRKTAFSAIFKPKKAGKNIREIKGEELLMTPGWI